jgi:hypothetical protein
MLRLEAETILIKRAGAKMTAASMDGATIGANADLVDPIVTALLDMGLAPASIATVTDDDLSAIGLDSAAEFLDRAELRLLQNIAGNLTLVDVTVGPRREALSQLRAGVEKAIERLSAKVQAYYTTMMDAGVIGLDFQSKGDDLLV